MEEPEDKAADTTGEVDNARQEVARTEPAKAPLPDVEGLARTLSPVDLPEPATPLPDPLRWTVTVMAVAGLFLALLNAHSIRGWAYELKPTPFNQRIIRAAEGWYDLTAAVGLAAPAAQLRGWWGTAKAARFPGQAQGDEVEAGGDES